MIEVRGEGEGREDERESGREGERERGREGKRERGRKGEREREDWHMYMYICNIHHLCRFFLGVMSVSPFPNASYTTHTHTHTHTLKYYMCGTKVYTVCTSALRFPDNVDNLDDFTCQKTGK